jgi:hypothetical protein
MMGTASLTKEQQALADPNTAPLTLQPHHTSGLA